MSWQKEIPEPPFGCAAYYWMRFSTTFQASNGPFDVVTKEIVRVWWQEYTSTWDILYSRCGHSGQWSDHPDEDGDYKHLPTAEFWSEPIKEGAPE